MSMRRPTKYNQEVADRLILFIEQGLTIKDVCCEVGISPDTCSRWRQKYPEFCREVYGSVEKATFLGGRLTPSQNTTTIDHIGERWVFAYLHAKSPLESLYEAHRAFWVAELVVIELTMNTCQLS